jgi:peptidoglycan/xylan/chitin deacetylase (PgdA/CDA1 family)
MGIATRVSIATAATAALAYLFLRTDWRTHVRNRLKGQATRGARGHSRPWKKDEDPAVAADTNRFWCALDMVKWSLFSESFRTLAPKLYPPPTLCYYDVRSHPGVRGLVALTIDDAFCRQSPEEHSLVEPLRQLMAKHAAKATFFLTLRYSEGAAREREITRVVADGHELANHGEEDREYDEDDEASFARALDATADFISRMGPPSRWFRAPSASLSATMEGVLAQRGMAHAIGDCFANDPHIPSPRFISWCMCRRATHGSVLILHMPERGFREWELVAVERVLQALQRRGLRSVTLSELATAAAGGQPETAHSSERSLSPPKTPEPAGRERPNVRSPFALVDSDPEYGVSPARALAEHLLRTTRRTRLLLTPSCSFRSGLVQPACLAGADVKSKVTAATAESDSVAQQPHYLEFGYVCMF